MDRRAAALLALLVVAGAAYYVVEMRGAHRREAAIAREDALFPYARADVAGIELSSGVRLTRADDRFDLVEPVAAPADPAAVARLVDALLGARCENRFAVASDSLAVFGLAEPRAWCAISGLDGSRRVVDLGAEIPTGNRLYARERGGSACCVVWGSLLRECQRRADELRDRRLLIAKPGDVATLRLERSADTLVIERDARRGWRIARPRSEGGLGGGDDAAPASHDHGGRASSEAVAALFEGFSKARVLAFADDADPDSVRTAAAATLRRAIVVHARAETSMTASAGAPPDTLLVGFPSGPGAVPLAIRSSLQPRPAAVDLDLVALLDVPIDSLLETRILLAAPERVRRLVVERDTGRLALERTDEGWSVVAPETLAADPVLVRALLRNLDNERIIAWRRDLARDAAGLDPPRARLLFEFEGPVAHDEILIGGDAPGGVFAQFAGDSAVFVLSATLMGILPGEASLLETRQILAAPIDAARSLTLTFDRETPLRLARRPGDAGDWVDERGQLPASRAAAIAGFLSALTPVDRLPMRDDAALLGFDAAMLSVVWDGAGSGRLEVADPLDPDRRFGRVSRATGTLYLFLQSDIDSLRRLVTP